MLRLAQNIVDLYKLLGLCFRVLVFFENLVEEGLLLLRLARGSAHDALTPV